MRFLLSFVLRALARPSTPAEQLQVRVATARHRVLKAARGKCTGQRLAEAQCRAERSVLAGLTVDESARRASAWARCAIDRVPATAGAVH
jgi:hypothetical protein